MIRTLIIFIFGVCSAAFAQESKVIVKSIYFGGGSYYIDQAQTTELTELVKSIKDIEYYDISIMSHTDNIGSMEMNQYLSKMRRTSAMDLLKSMDLPYGNIRYRDFGFTAPAFDNNTYQGRAANRRVDIQFKPIVF